MKLITRNTDYAIRALVILARNKNKITSVPELVKETKIPKPFIRGIMQELCKKGISKSFKGKGGGFLLKKPAKSINLVELIMLWKGSFKLNECFLKKHICPNIKTCALKKKIDKIEKSLKKQLSQITIASIAH